MTHVVTSGFRSILFSFLLALFAILPALHAENKVMGEIQFVGLTKSVTSRNSRASDARSKSLPGSTP